MKLFFRIMLMMNVCLCLLLQLNANPKELKQKNYFIENKGQWDDEVRFLARVNGMNAWITDNGVVYDFYTFGEGRNNDELGIRNYELKEGTSLNGSQFTAHGSRKGHVVKMSFQNSEKLSESSELSKSYPQQFVGMNKSETYYNYFIGNDKSKWANNVSLYEEVLIKNVYAGIDFRFYFENGMLRYDLNISPFADLNKIKMKFEGQESLGINDKGELVIGTSIGNVQHQQLYAWQEAQDKKINCNFRIDEIGLVGFGTKDYKKEMALVIDPLVWSTFLGGTGGRYDQDAVMAMAVNLGNTYITGITESANFPKTPGAYREQTNLQGSDVFISMLSFDGSFLYFSTFFGGNGGDWGKDLVLDKANNVYVTGIAQSINFPVTDNAYDTSYYNSNYNGDVFVCKLSGDGTQLLYSTFIGGRKGDIGETIVLDQENNAYVAGYTISEDFPTTDGAFNRVFNDLVDSTEISDIFISKLSSDGSQLLYSTFLGGSNEDWISSIAIDNLNNLYITGGTSSNDFPTSSGVFQENFNGIYNTFVSKLNSDGTELIFSTFLGGSSNFANDIALDEDNNIFIAGTTDTIDFPTTEGAFNRKFNGFRDSYILKLSGDGKDILYSTLLGGNDSSNQVNNIAIDKDGDIYASGTVRSANFPTTVFALDDSFNGSNDIFISKLDSSLSTLLYSTYFGGKDGDRSSGLAVDNEKNIYVAGSTLSHDFPSTQGAFNTEFNGGWTDVFISKISIDCDIRGFDYPNFQYTDNFNFVRDAKAENNALVLTTSEPWQKGAVWYKEKVPIKKGFTTTFSFRISEGVNNFNAENYPGADGFAFVIQNYSPDAIGSSGGGIGFSGIPNSLAVEFDTYKNDGEGQNDLNDKDENHFHIFSNGTLPNTSDHSAEIPYSSGISEDSLLIPNGREIFGKIQYNVSKTFMKTIIVAINSTPNFEKYNGSEFILPYFDIPLDFDSEEFAWIGFTSATGNAYEKHEILSWSFCPTPTNAVLVAVEENEIISDNINNTLEIFPNPAFDFLNIEYSIANAGYVSIDVFDVLGNKVKVVDYGFVESGRHHVVLSLSNEEQTGLSYFPSGMYYLVLRNNENSVYGKFGVMK